jgi:hypothetical protein
MLNSPIIERDRKTEYSIMITIKNKSKKILKIVGSLYQISRQIKDIGQNKPKIVAPSSATPNEKGGEWVVNTAWFA